MMRRLLLTILAGALAFAAPVLVPPARAGLGDIAESMRSRLDPVLLTYDLLVEPGKEVALEAGLRTGMRLQGMEGKRLQFLLGDKLLGEARTDKDGRASIPWKVPAAPGDHRIAVKVRAEDQPERPVREAGLLVAARNADAPLVVVDLDKTLVASGFERVLAGGAKPMEGSALVINRLAKDHTIVYLTHRPDPLGPESKAWIADNAFPAGPVLTSTMATMMSGSGTYKSARLEAIKRTYANVSVGIGDKLSDAQVYAENGVRSILILHVNWSKDEPKFYEKLADQLAALPDTVQVVTNWSQISEVLFDRAAYTKDAMIRRLREVAADLRKRGED